MCIDLCGSVPKSCGASTSLVRGRRSDQSVSGAVAQAPRSSRSAASQWLASLVTRGSSNELERVDGAAPPASSLVRRTRSIQLQVVLLRARTDDHSVRPIRLTLHVIAGLFMAAQDACARRRIGDG
jgi:hypothetical protein